MLPLRTCGGQGFECLAQGLGCMGMSGIYSGFESEEAQAEAARVLDKAAELKGIMLDTSDAYGPHTNEVLIGKTIAKHKDVFKIATKCGFRLDANAPRGFVLDSSPEYIKKACQDSLDRLGIECIDLYYLHRHDMKTPIEDVMCAFKELVEEGKIKYVGVSEMGVASLRKAHALYPITAYQMEWSLFTRDVEEELVPTCRELGIGIVTYSPLGRGFLTGAITSPDDIPEGDYRRTHPRFMEYMEDNLKLVDVVKEVAAAKECTPSQVALAWVQAQGDDVFPIPGTKRVSRFEENLAAFDVQLTEDDMSTLAAIADKIKGTRGSEVTMSVSFHGQKAMGW